MLIDANTQVMDRLDAVIVRVTTWVSAAFFALLILGWLATMDSALAFRAVNPAIVTTIGVWMLRRGRPRALLQLLIGGVPVTLYTGFVDTNSRSGAILGAVTMAIIGALLVRRHVIWFMVVTAGALVALGFWWDIGSGVPGAEVSGPITHALMFVLVGSLVVWLRREHHQAEDRLTHLLDSKDELIASVSHELRTPLTSVLGYAEVLNDQMADLPPDERDELVSNIAIQGRELAYLIDDLLVAARVDINALTVSVGPIDLAVECESVVTTMHDRGDITFAGPPAPALGDPSRVRQIVRNLLTNAVRYGGDTIAVSTGSDGVYSYVVVSDDGEGVPEPQVEQIFEAYKRADARPGLTAAVGLGLTVARRLARLMSGDVIYRRMDGRSEFQLWLPMRDSAELVAATGDGQAPGRGQSVARGDGERPQATNLP